MHNGRQISFISRSAFSLTEMLIVMIIIGVVYKLAINNFQKIDENIMEVSLKNLKEYLQKLPHKKSVRFLCLDDCRDCRIIVDNKIAEELEDSFDGFLNDTLNIYRYDDSLIAFKAEQKPYFNKEGIEEDVCFSYTVDRNGIGEQVLLEFNDRVYDYSSSSLVVPTYDSIEDALRNKQDLFYEVLR